MGREKQFKSNYIIIWCTWPESFFPLFFCSFRPPPPRVFFFSAEQIKFWKCLMENWARTASSRVCVTFFTINHIYLFKTKNMPPTHTWTHSHNGFIFPIAIKNYFVDQIMDSRMMFNCWSSKWFVSFISFRFAFPWRNNWGNGYFWSFSFYQKKKKRKKWKKNQHFDTDP